MIRAYTAAAVRAAEEPLLAAGPPGALMAHAAFALATEVAGELRSRRGRLAGARVLALVGGGSNGGDALHAAAVLARRGVAATAALLTPAPHAGGADAARSAGVRLLPAAPAQDGSWVALEDLARGADAWLDGLAGIGVRGGLREPLAGAVRALVRLREDLARSAPPPLVVAVDTPSGIGVDDGTLPGPVLTADLTVTMGAAKPGLLLPPAAHLAGRVRVVDIGLAPGLEPGEPAVARLETPDVAAVWPVPSATAHKYERGVLGVVAGSARYPGAGLLAVAGALGTGLGMVRYLGPPEVLGLVHAAHPEVVGAAGRVQAWCLGSGVDPDDPDDPAVRGGLEGALDEALGGGLPVVLDAGALALLDAPGGAGPRRVGPHVVLTPHAGELAALLRRRGVLTAHGGPPVRADVEAEPLRWARVAAAETGATVLLKGAVTVVAAPGGAVLSQAEATPWLATAGAGDVLAGVVGALLAGSAGRVAADHDTAATLAAAAAFVHGRAAVAASGGGPVRAGDVARGLPAAIRSALTGPVPRRAR